MKKLFLKLFKYWYYTPAGTVPKTPNGVVKLYLDDVRPTPEGWIHAFKIEEIKDYLLSGPVAYLSLDHDLGASYLCHDCYDLATDWRECSANGCHCKCHLQEFIRVPTGYDLCLWMAENDRWPENKPTIHSANPVGRVNMQAVIDRYWHEPGTPKKY